MATSESGMLPALKKYCLKSSKNEPLATLRCKSSHLLAAIHRCRTASTCYNVALLLLQYEDSGGKKRDPFATRAAECLGRFVCRGSGRVVGTMDAGGRRV